MSQRTFDEEALHELRRELRVREKHYPRWIEQGTLRSDTAALRIALLQRGIEIVAAHCEQLSPQQGLFREEAHRIQV